LFQSEIGAVIFLRVWKRERK